MKETEQTAQKIEGLTGLEGQVINGLDHMIQRSLSIRKDIEMNQSIAYGQINDKGELITKHFDIDARLLGIVNKTIMNRHDFYIKGNPKLEEVAKDMRDTRYAEANEASLTPRELSKMWDKE